MKIQKKLNEEMITEAEEKDTDVVVIKADDSKEEAEKKVAKVVDDANVDISKAEEEEWIDDLYDRKLKAGGQIFYNENSLHTENVITKALDDCLALALRARDVNHTETRANIRIIGLPGSGKTASVYDWAADAKGGEWEYKMIWDDRANDGKGGMRKKRRHVSDTKINLVYLNMKNNDLDAFINGYTIHRDAKDGDEDEFGKVGQAYSSNLDSLDKPNSIVFLDEYTRQKDDQIRGSVLTLINEHYIAGKDHGKRYFPNFLFTIAVENPKSAGDNGVANTNQAERTRFDTTLDHLDSDPKDTLDYLKKRWHGAVKQELEFEEPNYDNIEAWLRTLHLGEFILKDPRFKYDNEPEVQDELDELGCNALNTRVFTTMLENRGWSKDLTALINWINDKSKFLTKNVEITKYDADGNVAEQGIHKATKQMLLDIIKDYKVPSREDLFARYGVVEPEKTNVEDPKKDAKTPVEEPKTSQSSVSDYDDDDDGLEDDDDAQSIIDSSKMYGAANKNLAGTSSTVSSAEAKNKVNDLMKKWGF